MPRAARPYKIIEKINDNAYKLELPPEFGVSPTFNIVDLKPYLGEEDELESRTTPFQEGEDDEDITPSDAPTDPPTIMQGPMTRAQMCQLNLEVSSFLSDTFLTFENRLLPNDVILLRNIGEGHEGLRGRGGGEDDQQGDVQQEPEARSNMISSLPRPSGPVCLKLVTQDASRLCF